MYRLRTLEKKDIGNIKQWCIGADVIASLGVAYRLNDLNMDIKSYAPYLGNRDYAIRCAVVEDGCDKILGLVSLVSIDFMNQSAEYRSIIVDKEGKMEKMETFAVNAMLHHAFIKMNLQRVELAVPESNKWAIQLYEKCGLKYEGRKRRATYYDGEFADMLMYSALKEEYVSYHGENTATYEIPEFCINVIETKECIDKVIRICDDAFHSPVVKRDNYRELLDKFSSSASFICAYNREVLGYAVFYANDYKSKTAYVSLIAVRPEFQRLRIGSAILNTCQDIAMIHGMHTLLLEVDIDNEKGISFYRRHGFIKVEENNKILMRKNL